MLNDTSLPELFSEEFDETRALWHKNKQTALSRALNLGSFSLPNEDGTSIVNNDGVACLKIPSNARGNILLDFYDNPERFKVSTHFVKNHYGKGKAAVHSLYKEKTVLNNNYMISKCVEEMAGKIVSDNNIYSQNTRYYPPNVRVLRKTLSEMGVDYSNFNTVEALKLLVHEKLNGSTVQYGAISSIIDENHNSLIVGSGNPADAKVLEIFFNEAFQLGTLRVSVEPCEDAFVFNKQFLVFYDLRDLSVQQVQKIRINYDKDQKWLQSVDNKIQYLKQNGVLFRIIPNFKKKKFFVDYMKNDGTRISDWITEKRFLSL